jgi:ABC-2 type transport system ATP-binding protein
VHLTIDARFLTKKWGSDFKLGPINFQASPGETIAVFGKNGAGKSTFFQLLGGCADRSEGELRVCGHQMSPDAIETRRHTGYLPQESALPEWSTPEEILSYTAHIRQIENVTQAVEKQLTTWDALKWKHLPLGKASHGMQRRIGLAVAMLHNPDLLILDEPFNALDIVNARTLENIVEERSQQQKTTLISIHTPLLAAELCPRAILLENGHLEELNEWANADLKSRAHLINQRFFGGH